MHSEIQKIHLESNLPRPESVQGTTPVTFDHEALSASVERDRARIAELEGQIEALKIAPSKKLVNLIKTANLQLTILQGKLDELKNGSFKPEELALKAENAQNYDQSTLQPTITACGEAIEAAKWARVTSIREQIEKAHRDVSQALEEVADLNPIQEPLEQLKVLSEIPSPTEADLATAKECVRKIIPHLQATLAPEPTKKGSGEVSLLQHQAV